jgi:hypothetical protein
MKIPKRSRKVKRAIRGTDPERDGLDLRMAEYSAPFGEELPWRVATGEPAETAESWRDLKPERGRLH